MQPYDSCRLLHHNLTSYIVNPFTDKAYFDYELFYKHAYEALILGDNLVDMELEAISRIIHHIQENPSEDSHVELDLWKKVAKQTKDGRRCGIGFLGLADAIAMLKLSLNSSEALTTVTAIMHHKMKGELDATIDLAILKGTFEGFDRSLEFTEDEHYPHFIEGNNEFYQFIYTKFPEQAERMMVYGRRNISWSTVAPTGTTSMLALFKLSDDLYCFGTSSGIEPVYAPWYTRRRKCMKATDKVDFIDDVGEKFTNYYVLHEPFKLWCSTQKITTYKEDGTFSIRKPDYTSIDDLELLFKESAWFGSCSEQLDYTQRLELQSIVQRYTTHSISSTLNLPEDVTTDTISNIYFDSWKKNLKGVTVYRNGSRDGILITATPNVKKEVNRDAPKRPKELDATLHVITSKGVKYGVLVGLYGGIPYEVFAIPVDSNIVSGKGVIRRLKKRHYEYVGEDSTIIPELHLKAGEEIHNLCTLDVSRELRHGIKLKYIIDGLDKASGSIASFTSMIARVLRSYEVKTEGKCPKCGGKVIKESGCQKCLDCGDSLCFLNVKRND